MIPVNRILKTALLVSVAIYAFASKPQSFPSRQQESISPNGQFAVVNVDSATEPHHTLLLKNLRSNSVRKLFNYDRSVDVLWSPDSTHIGVTDYGGSNFAECLVFSVRDEKDPVNVSDQIQRGITSPKELASIEGNFHLYWAAGRWLSPQSLKVKVWGYGNANPSGFTRYYVYRLEEHR